MATSPRPEVEGEEDEQVKATAGRTSSSFSASTTATDESVAKSSVVGSRDCTAISRRSTGRRVTTLSNRRANRAFERGSHKEGIAARRRGEQRFIAVAAVVVVRIIERGLVKTVFGGGSGRKPTTHTLALLLFDFTEDCFLRLLAKNRMVYSSAARALRRKSKERNVEGVKEKKPGPLFPQTLPALSLSALPLSLSLSVFFSSCAQGKAGQKAEDQIKKAKRRGERARAKVPKISLSLSTSSPRIRAPP